MSLFTSDNAAGGGGDAQYMYSLHEPMSVTASLGLSISVYMSFN